MSSYFSSNKKRAFISFDFDNDESLRNVLNAQAKNPDSPFYFEDWSVKEPFPQRTWKDDVRTKIKQCDFMVVIISDRTYLCNGVLDEIQIANAEKIPCFGIYKQGENYYVPKGLEKRFISWTWDNIKYAINNLSVYTI